MVLLFILLGRNSAHKSHASATPGCLGLLEKKAENEPPRVALGPGPARNIAHATRPSSRQLACSRVAVAHAAPLSPRKTPRAAFSHWIAGLSMAAKLVELCLEKDEVEVRQRALCTFQQQPRGPRIVDIDGLLGLRGGTRDLNARRPPTGGIGSPSSSELSSVPPPPAATMRMW